jgi:hypothetical protein
MTTDLVDLFLKYGDRRLVLLFDLFRNQELMMAAIDDLSTAVSNLANVVQNEVIPALNKPVPNNDAAISAAASTLNNMATALHGAIPPAA